MNALEQMHQHVLERFTGMFERQTATRHFGESISELTQDIHADVVSGLEEAIAQLATPGLEQRELEMVAAMLRRDATRLARFDSALHLLLAERMRQWQGNDRDLKRILLEFHHTAQQLAGTVIDKRLLERQSEVLKAIIQSHEKVTQWEEFIRHIVIELRAIFPFDVLFIAFAEQQRFSLYHYFVGSHEHEAGVLGREAHLAEAMAGLGLAPDVALDIKAFPLEQIEPGQPIEDVRLVCIQVPEHATFRLAGIQGVAYGAAREISPQEQEAIRSILEVMAMVAGSSRALSRTISELEYYSSHDPLTGLHNRRYFNEMLEYEIGRSERHGHEFSVLMLDLDSFKDVNDTYGHLVGDAVLQQVAETIRSVIRKGDVPARIGGDEFAVILTETARRGALAVAEKLCAQLRAVIFEAAPDKTFHITTSIGVASYPGDAQTVPDLMSGADLGLYRAKELGKDHVGTLDALEERIQANRVSFDSAEKLRTALKDDRIVPYFQPIVDCRTGEIFACETLARLLEPNGEIVSAGRFIETIEKYGLSRELDRTIIAQALAATRSLIDEGHGCPRVFINLSAREIQDGGIIGFAERLCTEFAIPPHTVVFEIMERDAIGDMAHMRTFLNRLRKKGFLFALDDFGCGYNSFHYLHELSFEFVKIDGSFVRNILASKTDYALVRNLSRLCQDLGIRTIAEFVESADVLAALREMGIDYAQGFHVGRPRPRMAEALRESEA